ncbi:hypothetical protein SH2C18_43760 [Clostridium sediminicola]|uniref:ComEC/Rec2 family competence protein n=1 Tax=Clostridium sediminicola TaxID=3114879 RepID=UPI0031F27F98
MEKPIIFITFSFLSGIITALILNINIFYGAAVAASFAFIMLWLKWNEAVLNFIFFFLGIVSFLLYFKITIPSTLTTRIVFKSDNFCVAKYKNRKIFLGGDLKEVSLGEKICVKGEVIYNKDLYKGVVGSIYVKEYFTEHSDIISKLYSIKENIYYEYSLVLGEEYSADIMATCFGDTQYLDYNKRKEMNRLGISHIMAVSGFHVAIIYGILEFFLGIWGLIILFIYIVITGMKASSLRAFIMLLLMKVSKKIYRNYDNQSALAFSALVLLIFNPYYITDIGFCLSFLATSGIILYYPKFRRELYKLPSKIRDGMSITLSAQFFTVPYLMMSGMDININSIPGNLVIVPLYTLVIVIGNIGVLLVKIKPIFKIICYGILNLMTAIKGASFLMLKISPSLKTYDYIEGIVVILIYMCYIFVKRGYDEVKFFPLIIMSFLLIYKLGII